jgi:hypothetical protein
MMHCLQLLREVETNGRIIQVSTVQINPDKTNTGLVIISELINESVC